MFHFILFITAETLIDKFEKANDLECKFYALAKDDFQPTTNYGLKFDRYEKLKILDSTHENIWIASDVRNKYGFVPARLLAQVWYAILILHIHSVCYLYFTYSQCSAFWYRGIRRRSDYIMGFVTPAIGLNKSKKLTWLIASVHNTRGKVWMNHKIHGLYRQQVIVCEAMYAVFHSNFAVYIVYRC